MNPNQRSHLGPILYLIISLRKPEWNCQQSVLFSPFEPAQRFLKSHTTWLIQTWPWDVLSSYNYITYFQDINLKQVGFQLLWLGMFWHGRKRFLSMHIQKQIEVWLKNGTQTPWAFGFSYDFPRVFLWFSQGFPMILPQFAPEFPFAGSPVPFARAPSCWCSFTIGPSPRHRRGRSQFDQGHWPHLTTGKKKKKYVFFVFLMIIFQL